MGQRQAERQFGREERVRGLAAKRSLSRALTTRY